MINCIVKNGCFMLTLTIQSLTKCNFWFTSTLEKCHSSVEILPVSAQNSLDVSKHASLDVQDRSSTQYISDELGRYWFYLCQPKPSPDKPEQRWEVTLCLALTVNAVISRTRNWGHLSQMIFHHLATTCGLIDMKSAKTHLVLIVKSVSIFADQLNATLFIEVYIICLNMHKILWIWDYCVYAYWANLSQGCICR